MPTIIVKPILNNDDKYRLITANLQEVIGKDIIRNILPERALKLFWGTATTDRPHAAYFVPAVKIAQFLHAGCSVTVLLADLHGFLDADKAPEQLLEDRAQYYERVIRALLASVGVDQTSLTFVRGSSYQLTPAYTRDLLRLSKLVSVVQAVKASSEIVKTMGEPSMADGLYPLMQLLDEQYLGVDGQFGGLDQRKTFMLAHDTMSKMGFSTRAHLMNPMVPGLAGGKMSSSNAKSKIDLVDSDQTIGDKIQKARCSPRVIADNGILAFIQHVLLPLSGLQAADGVPSLSVVLDGDKEPTTYRTFERVAADYEADRLTPQLAKNIVKEGLVALITPIREAFEADDEWQRVSASAYGLAPDKAAAQNGTTNPDATLVLRSKVEDVCIEDEQSGSKTT